MRVRSSWGLCLLLCGSLPLLAADRLEELAGSPPAARSTELARQLQQDPDVSLPEVISAMSGASAVAQNWLLGVAQSVADRDAQASEEWLRSLLKSGQGAPAARFWAFEFVTGRDPAARRRLLDSMLEDRSLELRFEAVEQAVAKIEEDDLSQPEQLTAYRSLLDAARSPEQVQRIAKRLSELGEPVDLQGHFGFVADWRLVGVFDNVGGDGFDVVYPPERDYLAGKELQARYDGKDAAASFQEHHTEAENGQVDLNPLFDNAKGAIVYGLAEVMRPDSLECEVRLGSPNACKVWVNGELLIAREVYHAGGQIDQYTAAVTLQPGSNTVLVKICQNEQTESWAQDWTFQLRFTDPSGLAIR